MISVLNILMQTSTQPTPTGPQGPGSFIRSPFFLILLMLGVFYFMLFRGSRRDKRARQDMLSAVAKNDRVLTIGGLLGTVVSVRDDELVIKVDESTNTKVTVIRSAIKTVLARDEKVGDK